MHQLVSSFYDVKCEKCRFLTNFAIIIFIIKVSETVGQNVLLLDKECWFAELRAFQQWI